MPIIYRNTFTAADGTNLTAITPEVGSAMTAVTTNPSLRVTNNRARVNVGNNYGINATPSLGADANYIVRLVGRQLTSASFAWKFWARATSDLQTSYEVYYEPSFLRLRAIVAGTPTTLGSTTAWAGVNGSDHTVELEMNGTQILVRIDGVVRLGPFTNSAVTSAGVVALETAEYTANTTTAGWHWDSLEVDTLAAAGPSGGGFSGTSLNSFDNFYMPIVIPQNTATATLRRIPFVLVDATDFATPEDITVTGVKASLSFNGGTAANSTNDVVKVDGATGRYYLELTQAEANNALGTVHGTLQPTGCARTYLAAIIGPSTSMTEALTEPLDTNLVQINNIPIVGNGTNPKFGV